MSKDLDRPRRLTKDEIDDLTADTEHLPRRERRKLKKQKQKMFTRQGPLKRVVDLSPVDDLLDKDSELSDLHAELAGYNQAMTRYQHFLQYVKLLSTCGLSEQTIKLLIIPGRDPKGVMARFSSEVKRPIYDKLSGKINATQDAITRQGQHIDEEEKIIIKTMDKEGSTTEEIIKEMIRGRNFSIELLKIQIDELEQPQKKARAKKIADAKELGRLHKEIFAAKRAEKNKTEEETNEEEAMPKDETEKAQEVRPFNLEGWDIQWTTRYWSVNPNHFETVPTDSRESALASITQLGRNHISIKPSSVLNALEFHLLDKDRIQKALSSRLKYGPEEQREWVKIKRGRDRIGILIDEKQPKKVVFFVGGRDDVYRGLN